MFTFGTLPYFLISINFSSLYSSESRYCILYSLALLEHFHITSNETDSNSFFMFNGRLFTQQHSPCKKLSLILPKHTQYLG